MFIFQILMLVVCIAHFCSAVPTVISTAALSMKPSAKGTPPAKVTVSAKPTTKPTAKATLAPKATPAPKLSMKPTVAKATVTTKPSSKAMPKK